VPTRQPIRLSSFGIASHVLAGALPFVSSGTMRRLGLFQGVASLYAVGSIVLAVSLARGPVRSALARETRALLAGGHRTPFLLGLAGFAIAGVAYYVGLADSPQVAEYVFLTRLDWLVQAPVAILLLGEPWTRRGLTGGVLALAGGVLLTWTGSIGTSGIAAAGIYIAASLAGYSYFKRLSAARGSPGAVALTMWRHWVNTAGFTLLAFAAGQPASGWTVDGLGLAALAGVLIVILFLLRFMALTGIPLWVLAVQAPTQALVAIVVTLATGGSLPAPTLVAIGLVVAGEVLVTAPSSP
jgi:drug/metabolite transporter (DMT)-like permease